MVSSHPIELNLPRYAVLVTMQCKALGTMYFLTIGRLVKNLYLYTWKARLELYVKLKLTVHFRPRENSISKLS